MFLPEILSAGSLVYSAPRSKTIIASSPQCFFTILDLGKRLRISHIVSKLYEKEGEGHLQYIATV
jgi:hypothetical protein